MLFLKTFFAIIQKSIILFISFQLLAIIIHLIPCIEIPRIPSLRKFYFLHYQNLLTEFTFFFSIFFC